MNLRDKIVGMCPVCEGRGIINGELCNCSIKFRVFNRLISGGFNEQTLELISTPTYTLPIIERGAESLQYFIYNVFEVLQKGLGLFLFSKENGRGKTTLAHYLAYVLVWPLSKTENYDRTRTYAFEDIHRMCEKEKSKEEYTSWKSTLLVIDDLGSEDRSSAWKRDSIIAMLHRILHYRRNNKLVTIFTSNYAPESLSAFYKGTIDSVLEIRPDGIIGGRLLRQIDLGGGEDFRLGTTEWPVAD